MKCNEIYPFDSLEIEELFTIRGGVTVEGSCESGTCETQKCSSDVCSTEACNKNACESISCNTHAAG